MFDTATICWGLFYGAIGTALAMYGFRQRKAVPTTTGVVLTILPMFTTNPWVLSITGVLLILVTFIVRV